MSGEPAGVDTGGTAVNENVIRLIGVSSGVTNLVALTAVSYVLFETD